MEESCKRITDLMVGKGGDGHNSAIIREDKYTLDYDVDPKAPPVKGNPEDLKALRHRGTV